MILERLHPLALSYRPVKSVWGNSDWSDLFNRPTPELAGVGELWLNDDRPGGSAIISGSMSGRTLHELVKTGDERYLGRKFAGQKNLPLLIKFINPTQWLSVQVHPDDTRAPRGSTGKSEAWHILSGGPEAEIIFGLSPGHDLDGIRKALAEKRLPEVLNRIKVGAGDAFFIPAGTIHALGPDQLLFEIQQNADVTYRFYDWDRLDEQGNERPLHVNRAFECLTLPESPPRAVSPLVVDVSGGRKTFYAACRYFVLAKLELTETHANSTDGLSAVFLTCVSGRGEIKSNGHTLEMARGQTVMLPAELGDYAIVPHRPMSVLESSSTDLQTSVAEPLGLAGYTTEEIHGLAGPSGSLEFKNGKGS